MAVYFLLDQKVTKNQGKNNPSTHRPAHGPGDFASPTRMSLN
jgi:hypothetical protein